MKIAFIVSSLEPGRDGVGDYTRRLAGELIRQGHDCRLLSLNEKVESRKQKAENRNPTSDLRPPTSGYFERQLAEGTEVECLRLPDSLGWPERIAVAQQFLKVFSPDWVSLQYVCYGYHPKGLAWRWNPVFKVLGAMGKHRHLMFHELWISPPPFHRHLIGLAQRWIVRGLHRCFRPDVVTTSMPLYQRRLSSAGITAGIIPLFGNIPIVRRDDDRIDGLLQTAGSRLVQKPRAAFLNGIFFGTIHPDFNVTPLSRWLAELHRHTGKAILLTIIGRAGKASERLAQQLTHALPAAIEVISLGEQSEEIISQALQFADFGINTGSPKFLAKSGTFAAMQEHGLPVVLADGELDSMMLRNGVSPVVQFSTQDSVVAITNHAHGIRPKTGVAQVAAHLTGLFQEPTLV